MDWIDNFRINFHALWNFQGRDDAGFNESGQHLPRMYRTGLGESMLNKIKNNLRLIIQIVFTSLTNLNLKGFINGSIYKGPSKAYCVPGLNCYSCPGALGACPIGSMQAVLNSRDFSLSFYLGGFLTLVGGLSGRLTCGYLCPFGLVQDLLYRLPIFNKRKNLYLEKYLRKLKYISLGLFVIILPTFVKNIAGMGNPYFCKYICPSGTLMGGIPLSIRNSLIRSAIGNLFYFKLSILVFIIVLSIKTYRPFCKYLCPLGLIYGFFNPLALYKFRIDSSCIDCGQCQRVCKLDINTRETPNSIDCIRCGDCIKQCPVGAIETPFTGGRSLKKTKD